MRNQPKKPRKKVAALKARHDQMLTQREPRVQRGLLAAPVHCEPSANIRLSITPERRAHAVAVMAAALAQGGLICSPAEIAADAESVIAGTEAMERQRRKPTRLPAQLVHLVEKYCVHAHAGTKSETVWFDIYGAECGVIFLGP